MRPRKCASIARRLAKPRLQQLSGGPGVPARHWQQQRHHSHSSHHQKEEGQQGTSRTSQRAARSHP
eukprot:11174953-Lingulodinium_polyedra.AAC.1